jgi:large subunit ribosomal protein L32
MPNPRRRHSKARRDKRRAHHGCDTKAITTCATTGESHLYHHAYYHEGDLYYKGKMVMKFSKDEVVEEDTEE